MNRTIRFSTKAVTISISLTMLLLISNIQICSSQALIKDSINIYPKYKFIGDQVMNTDNVLCKVVYWFSDGGIRTHRPVIDLLINGTTYSVINCQEEMCPVISPLTNEGNPISPINKNADVSLTYRDAPNSSGTIVSYPSVELVEEPQIYSDKRVINVILHFNSTYYSQPYDQYFGTIEFIPIKTIEIISSEQKEVWPTFTKANDGNKLFNRFGYYPSFKYLQIKVTDPNNTPVPNVPISVTTEFVEESGGHSHLGENGVTELPYEKRGEYYWKDANGDQQHDYSIQDPQGGEGGGDGYKVLLTDQNGIARIDSLYYLLYSGRYVITAKVGSDASIKDSIHLIVRVPSLFDFRSLTQLYWSFNQSSAGELNHPINTWCASEVSLNLPFALQEFYEETGVVVSLNDMSLQYGGSFDVDGAWNIGRDDSKHSHNLHRVGLSVDINSGGLRNPNNKLNNYYFKLARIMIDSYGALPVPEATIHFEFPFNERYTQ